MPSLITVRGPNHGQRFELKEAASIIGRQPEAAVYLESLAVSRQHARVLREADTCYLEDMHSSNGTFLNGIRIAGRVQFHEGDTLQIGPYEFNLLPDVPSQAEAPQIIRGRVEVQASNHTLFGQNPAQKLEVMLEIAQNLGRNLDMDQMLSALLDHLLRLFPQADRGMVLLCEGDRLMVRSQRTRRGDCKGDYAYSRTIVSKALADGVGLLSEDVRDDRNLVLSATMVSLNLRSFLCVPLLGWEGKRLGLIQLDCLRPSQAFKQADLEMLSAICLQAAVVLQNAAYHVERIKEERLRQELLLARDIQQQFLPHDFSVAAPSAELFAQCLPAREVTGDLYDFFKLPDRRLAFYVGDVSGKGTPAALYMIAVRTLARHLAPTVTSAADFLWRLNNALADDNPTHLYVTMAFGIYDSQDGTVTLAHGGHPPTLLRKADGTTAPVQAKPGLLLGSTSLPIKSKNEVVVKLEPGDMLAMYSDGYHEATAPDGTTQFGVEGLCKALSACAGLTLEQTVARASAEVGRFTGPCEQQDDMTLLLLRRL